MTNSSIDGAGEVGDREDRLENGLQALVRTAAFGLVHHQELVVGGLLNLDEVRHLRDFRDLAEELAYASAAIESQGLGHRRSLLPLLAGGRRRRALHRRNRGGMRGPIQNGRKPVS